MQKGRVTSQGLLATVLLMQPKMWLAFVSVRAHCWLDAHQDPQGLFLQSCFAASQPSAHTVSGSYSMPGTWVGICFCWTFVELDEVLSAHISSLSRPPVALHSKMPATPHDSVLITNMLSVYSVLLCRSLIKTVNTTGQSIDPWGMPWATSHKLSFSSLTTQPHFHLTYSPLIQTISL